ncbi:hypothetical protein [Chryseobacterium pennipullorum]|uniref:Uncharacterized protein n=1 Tax=Chryseobacterium pennipullorum TaxID=2258963 RepID=A0A3D9B841_9FLAO|nr:hypothetical protein [Chryseobacterium pennipullorum]REC49508.1 hypothetical protein DRF67_03260 [Chryseobacterium pennipullorum]
MRSLKRLKITESIESKKLVFEEETFDKFDTITIYFGFSVMAGITLLVLKDIERSLNNALEFSILICLFIFSGYVLYCKFTEKYLKEIPFTISKEEAKKRIIEYGKRHHYKISKVSANLIFLNEPSDIYSLGKECEQTTIVFFKNNAILYTLIKEGQRSNFTVLVSQHLTRRDFKKLLHPQYTEPIKRETYFNSFFHGL